MRSSSSSNERDGRIVQVVASSQSTVFLTGAGRVYQTGTVHGHVYPSPLRVAIPMGVPCVEVAAGRHFVLARMEGGVAVVSWGAGHFGQLGVPAQKPSPRNSRDESDGSSSAASGTEKQITFT